MQGHANGVGASWVQRSEHREKAGKCKNAHQEFGESHKNPFLKIHKKYCCDIVAITKTKVVYAHARATITSNFPHICTTFLSLARPPASPNDTRSRAPHVCPH